jgi:hypothetical protein
MYKVAISTALALALGLAAVGSGHAAAVAPTAGMRAALAPLDTVELAQVIDKRVRVGPRGGVTTRTTVVGPGSGVARRTTVVGPGGGVAVRRGAVVGRPAAVVGRPVVVGRPTFVRTYRPWYRRAHFGTIVGGIALGSILTVAAVGVAPAYAPAPDTCWYWADPGLTTGYWDYC